MLRVLTLILLLSNRSITLIIPNNVLFVFIDDLRYLSDNEVILPNMKKMAAAGVTFKNAFVQQALCAPSRNSILTGRRPDTLRLYDFYSYWRHSIGNFTTLPQLFKEHGYETYSVGKVFHPGKSSNFTDDYPYSWSHYPYHPPTEAFKDATVCKDTVTRRYQKNLICPVNVDNQPGNTLPDLQSLEYAVEILRNRDTRKPFFLAVGFHKPHIPLKFPKHYLDRIPLDKVHPPKAPYKSKDMPLVAWHPWTDIRKRDDIHRLNISYPFGTMPPKWTLKIKQSYYAAALYIDHLVGKLMKHVNLRKTIVVLTSDHGWSLGENGLWAKYSNFDVALKVPLIFLGASIPHKIISTPVELIDIFPTLADLTGLDVQIPKCSKPKDISVLCFEGKSLAPFMNTSKVTGSRIIKMGNVISNDYKVSATAISQYPRPSVYPQKNSDKPRLRNIQIMGYSVRTKRYRYTQWVSFNNSLFKINWDHVFGTELYDHMKDPQESVNLYLEVEYKNITNYLSKLLRSQVDPV